MVLTSRLMTKNHPGAFLYPKYSPNMHCAVWGVGSRRQVHAPERPLGVSLVEVVGRRVLLTVAGELVASGAAGILNELDDLEREPHGYGTGELDLAVAEWRASSPALACRPLRGD
jgi:hypothetical protein